MIDLTEAGTVEVTISDNADGARLWLHVDGELRGRIYRIGRIVIDDRRTNPSTSAQDDGDGGAT